MSLGRVVLVPLTNPASVAGLMGMADQLVDREGGTVVPVTVVPPDAGAEIRGDAEALIAAADAAGAELGVPSEGLVGVHESVADGVLDAARDCAATLVLMGWRGRSTQRNVFGELIDTVVGRSRTPTAVVRLGQREPQRVLLPVSNEHLGPTGAGGLLLAADLAQRLGPDARRTVRLLRTGDEDVGSLPPEMQALSDRVHHDPRRYATAIGAAAEAGDLVIVPVAPTVSGLRTATTHVAWQAPESTLLVAIDVGPKAEDVDEATARAGQPAPEPSTHPDDEELHTVSVVARAGEVATTTREQLGPALRSLGTVGEVEAWEDEEGRRCLRTRVRVAARDSNEALAAVMTALHEAEGFKGAELRYELETSPGPDDSESSARSD
ncbi:hypothetical protein ER308_17135 [Egibacter rhizosphaerae]|uniref:UspA domain-containing protein n=1 Tax=Egibacter rhizosphaerae TaxID=1670831 RepID=A0A411YIR9_9ACTN|nr:universal stress protein [Egibacter rhizosphaerae]QBI21123.1 hypothetical protein ER308_17135 [Egibacter rhizosphaerae]